MLDATEKAKAPPVGKYLAQIAVVFAVQFGAGKIGESFPIVNSGGIGPVWPASGTALAALLLCGYRVWPGVAAGAFLLMLLSPVPLLGAAVYGIGNALAALTGAFLLRRVVNFDTSLSRLRDGLGLIVFGAFGSSIVSASIGVSVLYAAHLRGWSGFGRAWLIYWLGDSMGVLLVTPLVLALFNLRRSHPRNRISELVALLVLLTMACFVIFGDLPLIPVRLDVLAFAVLPFVIWAAIRFGVSGAALATLFIATIATVETAGGSGPFAQHTPFVDAVLLDVFFAVLSISGITLAAVIADRERAERERERLVREQAAIEARLRLAAIVESSDDAIMGVGIDEAITDWNKGAERLYGYRASEVIGRLISLLMPPDRSSDLSELRRAMKRGNSLKHYETVCQTKNGTRMEVSLTMSPIRDTEGRILGASVIGRDISERKRQEAILRESEERLRIAAEVGRMWAWEWDPGTDSVLRSAECAGILGLSRGAREGTAEDYFSSIHPDDRAALWGLVDSLTSEEPAYRTQYRKFRPDGALLWLEESGRATFDGVGKMVRLVGMTADITERKLAEEALRESEERLRLAAQLGKMYAFEWNAETHVTVRSGESANILNWMNDPTHDVSEQFFASVHPDDQNAYSVSETGVTTENPTYHTSYRLLRPDGSEIWLEEHGHAFFNAGGELLRTIGIVADITARKLSEEALSSVSRRVIEAEERERSRVARDLHEDIGQRLALLAIEIEQLKNDPPDQAAELHGRMDAVWKQTLEVLTDVKASAHELHSPRLEYLGLAAAMRSFCEEFGARRSVEIDFRSQDLHGPVSPDISLCLFRVLQEALHNALTHSGVQRFEVRLWRRSDEVNLTISDHGVGFEADAVTKVRSMGLIGMRERLKLLKGTFFIESQLMRGTKIHARIPLSSGSDSMRAVG